MVVRRYIDFLILLIPTPLVSVLFYSSIPTFCSFKKILFNTTPTVHSAYLFSLAVEGEILNTIHSPLSTVFL